jgi:CubicO group peptidase (beta-lactamase class C family)
MIDAMIDAGDLVPELADLCRAHEIVGAVVGVSIGGERSVAVHGVTDVGTAAAVEPTTAFQAGSVTKAMTATAVAMLVADGSVGLDEPVISYVPEFRVHDEHATRAITVRHLLTHTSGFDGDVWPDHGDDDGALGRLIAGVADLPQLSPSGRAFSYSNVGYSVLGRVVERVVDAPFEHAPRTMVDEPASARLECDVRRLDPGSFAVGHVHGPDGWVPIDGLQGPACLTPAGSRTWARVDDLLAFGELHLGRRSSACQDTLVSMREPRAASDRVLLAPFGGRDLVIVTPPTEEPGDHVLQSLRRVNRRPG